MEQLYWLGRERVSLQAAQDAVSAEARLIHYDLAGRYSVKAAETEAIGLRDSLLRDNLGGAVDGHPGEASHA